MVTLETGDEVGVGDALGMDETRDDAAMPAGSSLAHGDASSGGRSGGRQRVHLAVGEITPPQGQEKQTIMHFSSG